jgi:hypothetical protein
MTAHDAFPTDTVPWGGFRERQGLPPAPTEAEWVAHIAWLSTPKREYAADGSFQPWIAPATRSGQNDLAGVWGAESRDDSARSGSPDTPLRSTPSRRGAHTAT